MAEFQKYLHTSGTLHRGESRKMGLLQISLKFSHDLRHKLPFAQCITIQITDEPNIYDIQYFYKYHCN